ncbi:hypothetical protein CHELA40_50695 [Chelatococcus asaccharovorans]|nr:hypothetical protein CHELA17_20663 [Chelatococcus asaccharovorans]CAH1693916.1 hypothetical protein CHELA40_50695 [Chelatococcus asaccharovorans]
MSFNTLPQLNRADGPHGYPRSRAAPLRPPHNLSLSDRFDISFTDSDIIENLLSSACKANSLGWQTGQLSKARRIV